VSVHRFLDIISHALSHLSQNVIGGHCTLDRSKLNSIGFVLICSRQHHSAFSHGESHVCKSNSITHQSSGILQLFDSDSSRSLCSKVGMVGFLKLLLYAFSFFTKVGSSL
jgi:hypothetical protein